MTDKTRQWAGLAAFLAITFLAALIAALASDPQSEWYGALEKPALAPPDWLFGPVWTLLYAMMAVAAWLVWRGAGKLAGAAIKLYFVQLLFNALWPILFFGMHLVGFALVDVVLLWFLVAMTTAAFWQIRTHSGLLMLPYLAWTTYAAFVSYGLWELNG